MLALPLQNAIGGLARGGNQAARGVNVDDVAADGDGCARSGRG